MQEMHVFLLCAGQLCLKINPVSIVVESLDLLSTWRRELCRDHDSKEDSRLVGGVVPSVVGTPLDDNISSLEGTPATTLELELNLTRDNHVVVDGLGPVHRRGGVRRADDKTGSVTVGVVKVNVAWVGGVGVVVEVGGLGGLPWHLLSVLKPS